MIKCKKNIYLLRDYVIAYRNKLELEMHEIV